MNTVNICREERSTVKLIRQRTERRVHFNDEEGQLLDQVGSSFSWFICRLFTRIIWSLN